MIYCQLAHLSEVQERITLGKFINVYNYKIININNKIYFNYFRPQVSVNNSIGSRVEGSPASDIQIDNPEGNLEEQQQDNISLRSLSSSQGSQNFSNSDDDFTRLKTERIRQRRDKAMRKLVKSIGSSRQAIAGSNARSSLELDGETLLLTELAEASKIAFSSSSSKPENV